MNPILAPTDFALERSASSPSTAKPATWLEGYVAQRVAGAGAALFLAWDERSQGGALTSATKKQGAVLIAELVRLRNFLAGHVDNFDVMARCGAAVLHQNCNELSPSTCEALVDSVLEIVSQVAKAELN